MRLSPLPALNLGTKIPKDMKLGEPQRFPVDLEVTAPVIFRPYSG